MSKNPTTPGTYECSTQYLRDCEQQMIDDPTIEWADVLSDDQGVCLFWVMREVVDASESQGLDPALVFATMIDVDGTFLVEVNPETKSVSIDFRHTGGVKLNKGEG